MITATKNEFLQTEDKGGGERKRGKQIRVGVIVDKKVEVEDVGWLVKGEEFRIGNYPYLNGQ